MKNPLRKPKAPPFKVGTKLRYLGTMRITTGRRHGPPVDIIAPGIIVTIDKVVEGTQGTGRQLRDSDGPMFYEDDGEPILDHTRDGYSIYSVFEADGHRHSGRCISHDKKREWQVVKD
jgi:hypothetical protein